MSKRSSRACTSSVKNGPTRLAEDRVKTGVVAKRTRASTGSQSKTVNNSGGKSGPKSSPLKLSNVQRTIKGRTIRSQVKSSQKPSVATASSKHTPRRPPKFSWVVDGLLAGHGRPTLPNHIQFLCDNGIRYLVTFTQNRPRALLDLPETLQWVHIPIQDETPPSIEQIKKFVELVDTAKMEQKRVSAHCAWGRGRTGTMMACYLAKHRNLSADEAIAAIRELRPGSVDTVKQEHAIHSYVEELVKNP